MEGTVLILVTGTGQNCTIHDD